MSEQTVPATEGQKRVRLNFNPSQLRRVFKYKKGIADLIDYLASMEVSLKGKSKELNAEDVADFLRETATAKTLLQQASTMGVGAMTLDIAFLVFGSAKTDEVEPFKSGSATKKPVTVDVITFDDFVDYGKSVAANFNDEGTPLSFTYKEHPISNETKDAYVIPTKEGSLLFTPNDVLITGVQGEIYPCKKDIFEATYTW